MRLLSVGECLSVSQESDGDPLARSVRMEGDR